MWTAEKSCMLAASAASSEKELLRTLEVMFPPAVGSAKKAKPIRDLWGILFPRAEFMVLLNDSASYAVLLFLAAKWSEDCQLS